MQERRAGGLQIYFEGEKTGFAVETGCGMWMRVRSPGPLQGLWLGQWEAGKTVGRVGWGGKLSWTREG